LRLLPLIGSVSVYVNRCLAASLRDCASNNSALPSARHHLLAMDSDSALPVLSLVRADPQATVYLVCVQSQSLYAAWQVSAALAHTIVEVQAGVSVSDRVAAGETDYFAFFFQHAAGKGELQIALNPVSLDACPDLNSFLLLLIAFV
jgi:hypothetical protein